MAQEAYLIRVKGHLGQQWNDWFDGFTITNVERGEAIISGINIDQAALHGVLTKVRDLGLPLLGVSRAASGECLVAEREPYRRAQLLIDGGIHGQRTIRYQILVLETEEDENERQKSLPGD